MKYKIYFWLLNRMPFFMRSLPFIKKFYWQKEELERASKRAKEISDLIKWE